MYFYWKISYSENLLYTAPGQPGGTKTLSEGGGGWPLPGPTLATALYCCRFILSASCIRYIFVNIIVSKYNCIFFVYKLLVFYK